MSLLDRVRTTARTTARATARATRGFSDGSTDPQLPGGVWGAGALAVGVPWLGVVALAVLVWAVTPGGDTAWGQVVALGSAGWFLGTGGAVQADGVVVGVVPMGVWALAAGFTAYELRRLRAHTEQASRHLVPGFLAGYAAALTLAALITLAGPARPTPGGFIGVLSVPAVAAGVVVLRDDDEVAARIPAWLARAVRPAVWGLGALAAASALLTLAMLVVRWPTVSSLHAAVGAPGLASVGLVLGQLLFGPDLLVWALSFLAGPGFEVAAGGGVSVSGATPGLLPMVPALGVVPSEGHYPSWVSLLILVPVGAGAVVARQADRQWARLARWQDKSATAAAAVVLVALVCLGASLLASGPAGSVRLAHVGPRPWQVVGVLIVELAGGATVAVAAAAVRRRWVR